MSEATKAREMTPYDFREMEARDEEQILAQLQGKVVEEMIYQFKSGGRTVTGISWVGIKEIARRYGKIDTQLIDFQDLGNSVMFVVKAIDIEKGTGLLGTATQSKTLKRRDGTVEDDPFCVTKALSKAQRNAIRSIIPEEFFKAVFAELSKGAKQKSKQTRKTVEAEVTTPTEPERPPGIGPAPRQEPTGATTLNQHAENQELPQGVASLEELEGVFTERLPGHGEFLEIVPYADGFGVEPQRQLDEEIVYLVDHMVLALGGEAMRREGQHGREWMIPMKKA